LETFFRPVLNPIPLLSARHHANIPLQFFAETYQSHLSIFRLTACKYLVKATLHKMAINPYRIDDIVYFIYAFYGLECQMQRFYLTLSAQQIGDLIAGC